MGVGRSASEGQAASWERLSAGGTVVNGLLNQEAVLEAAHDIYTVFYQNAESEVGLPPSDWPDVPRLPASVQFPIISYYLGRVHEAWGYDPGLVLHHMGIGPDDFKGQALAIYRLMMGCLGHGVSLEDEHAEELDRASEVLLSLKGGAFDPSPCSFEGTEWQELAFEAVQRHLCGPVEPEEDWPFQPGETVAFAARMGTGETIEGSGTVLKTIDSKWGRRLVVQIGEDHPDRPGQVVSVREDEVTG